MCINRNLLTTLSLSEIGYIYNGEELNRWTQLNNNVLKQCYVPMVSEVESFSGGEGVASAMRL